MTTTVNPQHRNPDSVATHPDLPGIEIYLLYVDPTTASELLKLNVHGQRTISPTSVEKYATDMVADEWLFNGSPILITDCNDLIDGQHRLTAIVESGIGQTLLIVRGVSLDAMGTIDNGRRRSYADTLKMRGVANHALVAALNSRVWYWFHGNYGCISVGRVPNPEFLTATPSNSQKDQWMITVEKAYGINMSAAATFGATMARNRPGITSSTYALFWVLLSGVDKNAREQFFHEFAPSRQPSEISQPVMTLINRLARLRTRERFSKAVELDMLITIFNDWTDGAKSKTLTPPRLLRYDLLAQLNGWTELDK